MRLSIISWCLASLIAGAVAEAATVRSVGFAELVEKSGLIFEGRVVGESSRLTDDGRDIVTDVEFKVSRVLKGTQSEPRLVLSFSGGQVGDLTLAIHGSERPRFGETGVYFVEDPGRRQAHPFYGWSQGHFLTREDSASGVMQMFTRDGRAIVDIRLVASPDTPVAADSAAAGVDTAPAETGGAMTLDAFRARVAAQMERE